MKRFLIVNTICIVTVSLFFMALPIFDLPLFAESQEDIMVKRLIKMLNRQRASGGVCGKRFYKPSNPLKWDNRLAKAASVHASDMAENDRLSHNGRDGSDPGERIKSAGYRWKAFGENIGEGYRTPEDIFRAWMKSEGHCKNIMNPLFKDVGASRITNGDKTFWVLVFATPH